MTPRQRWWRILSALGVLVPCLWIGAGLRIESDIGRMLPRGGELERVGEVLQHLTARTIIDVGTDGTPLPEEALAAAAIDYAARLHATGAVAAATAHPAAGVIDLVEVLRRHAPVLLDGPGLAAAQARLDPDRIDGQLAVLRRRLLEPDGLVVRQRAAADPLGITDLALQPLQALQAGFRDVRVRDGCLVAGDGQHVLVFATPGFPPTDLERNRVFERAIAATAADLAAAHPHVVVRWIGSHRSSLDNAERIIADVWLVSLLGLGLSTVVAVLFLGFRFAFLSLVPAACGAAVAIAVLALLRGEVAGAALGFGSVLCGLCLDFTVHVLFHTGDRQRIAAGVVFLAAGSTAAAQAVLFTASLPGLADVGLFGATATVAAALFAVWLLPALVPARGRPQPLIDLPALLGRVRVPVLVRLLLFVVGVPVAAWGATRIGVDGDVRALNAVSPANAADEAAIAAAWGDAFPGAVLVVEAADLETALQRNEDLAVWLQTASAGGLVRDFATVAGVLPSARTQLQRAAAWRAACTAERRDLVAVALATASRRHGFKVDGFAPFLAFLAADPALLDPAELLGEGGPVTDRVQRTARGYRVQTPVYLAPSAREALRGALAAAWPSVLFVEPGEVVRALLRLTAADAVRLGALALAVVTMVLTLSLVRLELVLLVVIPLLLGLLATLGAMGACGLRLTLANSAFTVFLFGIAVDYAIILLHGRLERHRSGEDGTATAAAAVLFCGVTTLFGFGALAFATHPVLRSMGLTAVLGIGATLVTSLLCVPMLADLVLVRRGVNGAPALRHALTAAWGFVVVAGSSLRHRATLGAREPAAARRRALGVLQRAALRIRHDLPLGTRTYHGDQQLPAAPCIYVANHESIYDTVAVLALPRPLVMLVKPWVWRAPLFGPAVRAAGFLLTEGLDLDSLVNQARQRLEEGVSVLVFPEGTRSRGGRLGRFHSGAFQLAARLGVQVVPIALCGTRHVVPPGSWWVGDHDVHVVVLDAVDPRGFPGELGHLDLARHVRGRIAAVCDGYAAMAGHGPSFAAIVAGAYRYLGPVVGVYAHWKARLDPLVAALLGLVPGRGPVLVAGCGYGVMTTALAVAFPGRTIHAIDVDLRKVEVARAAAGDCSAVQAAVADLREAALPAAAAAVLVDVLHYWPPEQQQQILAAVARALPPGGILVCRDGCSDAGTAHMRGAAWERFALRTGFTRTGVALCYRSLADWSALITASGFRVIAVRSDLGRRSDTVFLCERVAAD